MKNAVFIRIMIPRLSQKERKRRNVVKKKKKLKDISLHP